MNLHQALESCTQRHLWAITQARGLNPGRSPTKAQLLALVEGDLGRQGALRRDLETLSLPERQALDLLLAVPEPLPLHALARAFGELRPYRPWRDDGPRDRATGGSSRPWLDPSPVERLVYLGLAFPARAEAGGWQEVDCLFVPADLRARLPSPPTAADQARIDPANGQTLPALPESDMLHDCFTFLSYLNCHDLAPLHRRWLTPRQFRPINDRFGRPEPLHRHGKPILGEKKTARLRFVHFLLEGAGLIALSGEFLKPTPAALTWLERTAFDRLRSLWQVWGEPQSDRHRLWSDFDLPLLPSSGQGIPLSAPLASSPAEGPPAEGRQADIASFAGPESPGFPLVEAGGPPPGTPGGWTSALEAHHRLLAHLRRCRPGEIYDLGIFAAAVCLQDLDFFLACPGLGYRPDPDEAPRRLTAPGYVREMLVRPVRWFGLVQLYGDRREPAAFRLTAAGAALLHGLALEDGSRPSPSGIEEPPAPAPGLRLSDPAPVLQVRGADLSVDAAPGCPPALLYRLEPWVAWLGVRRYRLLPAALHRALERGGSLDDLLQVLAEGTAAPLPPDLVDTLRGWAAEARTLVLRRPVLLQAHSRELLAELADEPALRRHFRETLSPRHVVVDAHGLESLVRELRRRGHHPHVSVSTGRGAGEAGAPDRSRAPGEAAHLLLAARVYNELARLIRPVSQVPAPVLDALRAALDDHELETVEQGARETLDRLLAALDGWTPHGPYQEALPVKESRPLIEAAIEDGQALLLEYWTAGREELTRRTVDPLRIEERRGVPYLVAHCHLRHAERVFRLDRIRAVTVTDAGTEGEDEPYPDF